MGRKGYIGSTMEKSVDRFSISLTVDVESHDPTGGSKFMKSLDPLLDELKARNIKATFFVNGEIINRCEKQICELIFEGHEIGLHGYSHRYLEAIGESDFRTELLRGFNELGEVTGKYPLGFRAPYFSLNRSTHWAPRVISETGFVYSSSVLPCNNPQSGFPGSPRTPFMWECGLLEFPSPVFGIGQWCLPVFGGGYLRVMPRPIVRYAAGKARRNRGSWTYCHPYDFDSGEPIHNSGSDSWLFRKLLGARRQLMLPRIIDLVDQNSVLLGDLARDSVFLSNLKEFRYKDW